MPDVHLALYYVDISIVNPRVRNRYTCSMRQSALYIIIQTQARRVTLHKTRGFCLTRDNPLPNHPSRLRDCTERTV